MSKIFVTGNLQFGRPSIIKKMKRPFESLDEMHEELIKKWNTVVALNDIVYHCGNFAWDPDTAETMLNKLNGNIYLIPGEDDNAILDLVKNKSVPKHVAVIDTINEVSELESVLSYWPMAVWPKQNKGYYNVHAFPNRKHLSNHKSKSLNVACDFWGYKPIELETVKELVNLNEEITD